MRLADSAIARRRFLRDLLGTWLGALAATLAAPLARYLVPPTPEPESVDLPLADFAGMALHEVRRFAWGTRPGLLQRRPEGYRAYVGVCTHLDCNVTWSDAQRRFYCACHEGWYDEDGRNVAGPPPRPLRVLRVEQAGAVLVVRRDGSGA